MHMASSAWPICTCHQEGCRCARCLGSGTPLRARRDTRALLGGPAGAANAVAFISDNPHPRLWRLLAEHSLGAGDWGLAEKGFVHCRDLAVGALAVH